MTTGLFERADIRALSEKLLGLPPGQGVLLSSAAGRALDDMLMSVSGVQPVGRGTRRQLTERGRTFLMDKLAETAKDPVWSGDEVLATLAGALPRQINGATLSGLWLRDCKAPLPQAQRAHADALGLAVFGDDLVRLRTLAPVILHEVSGGRHDMTSAMALLGELVLPERALMGLQGIEWQGRRIVTVENKGAFVDYPLQGDELLIYVPGRNTALAKQVIPLLPATIPWAHFGDLDQRGLEIAAELAGALGRPLTLWLPANVQEYVHHYARPLSPHAAGERRRRGKIPWQETTVNGRCDAVLAQLFRYLITRKAWLEQEVLITARWWQPWPFDTSQ
ncbi:Wadjet anti-phage system protein JetD domain-containing protein [Aeromonas sanarellii]